MARVVALFTGGTISMGYDAAAGGNIPLLDAEAILGRTSGLAQIAEVVPRDLGRHPASHLTFADLIAIWAVADAAIVDPATDGIVIVQGTDTIEETSFTWDLLHGGDTPVVVTGAMRASHEDGYDGPSNLRDAVTVAAAGESRGVGVVVSLAGTIEAGDDVQKTHTTARTTFQSPNGGSLGTVSDGRVRYDRHRGPRRHVATDRAASRIRLVTAGIDTDGAMVHAAMATGADGIVVAATGSGNTAPGVLAAAIEAMAEGIPVVLASRCAAGAVGTAYAFPGGGAEWVRAGAIPAGHLCAVKARVALALGVGRGLDHDGLARLLADPLP
jgi:L-asparaginase